MKRLILTFALVFYGCATAPPNLTPQASVAFKKHEIQKDLDLIRDIAVDASAQTPALISVNDAREVVRWHEAAITIIHDTSNWQSAVTTSLQQLQADLSPASSQKLKPYIALALSVLKEIK